MKKNGFVFQTLFVKAVISFTCLAFFVSTAPTCEAFQDSPQAVVDQLNEKMASLNGQLTKIEADINSGEGDLSALQSQYRDVLDNLNNTIEQLRESGLKAIEADPSNQKNIQTVMGILLKEADGKKDREVLMACDRLIAAGIHPAYFEYAANAGRIKIDAREIFDEALIRLRESKADDLPRVLLKTNKGDITVELYENEAPDAVANFITLVEDGFYSDTLFHSVIESFRAQTGGPTREDASRKDPGYTIYCECYKPDARPHFTDVLSMAVKPSRDTGGSQFIITLDRTTELNGKHTVFGRIIDGHEVADQLARTAIEINGEATDIPNADPDYILSAEVLRKRDHDYKFRKVGDPEEEEAAVPPPAEPETKSFDTDKEEPAMESADSEPETEKETESKEESKETSDAADEKPTESVDSADAGEDGSETKEVAEPKEDNKEVDTTEDVEPTEEAGATEEVTEEADAGDDE
ncbi:peptidylprolyl isomerase [bacterium]|nr:peptidylprolyl isomerase [bacterium]